MIGHWWAWANASARRKRHLQWLGLLMIVSVSVQAVLWTWYIEDAAISFAYARNLATGEGLVPYPGGERVEGYSNPTWVFLLAIGELIGIDSFTGAKWLGAAFGALTLLFAYLLASELRSVVVTGELRVEREDDTPLFAAIFLAGCSQFTIWNTSGLENSLFNFLLAVGLWRTLEELKPGRLPIGPVAYFLLAITRPEGMMYAAAAGFWAMVFSLGLGQGLLPTLRWLAAYFVPWTLYQVWHYQYFAWPLPNTYYAKTEESDFAPFKWDRAGWKYIRNWAKDVGQGALLPLWMVGITGFANAPQRFLALFAASAVVGVALPGSDWLSAWVSAVTDDNVLGRLVSVFVEDKDALSLITEMIVGGCAALSLLGLVGFVLGERRSCVRFTMAASLAGLALAVGGYYTLTTFGVDPLELTKVETVTYRVGVLALLVLILPRLVVGSPGWRVIVLCCDTISLALFFALWSGGDWMKGYRWMASLTVPASVIFAACIGTLAEQYQDLIGRRTAGSWVAWWGTGLVLGVAAYVGYWFGLPPLVSALKIPDATLVFEVLGVFVILGVAVGLTLWGSHKIAGQRPDQPGWPWWLVGLVMTALFVGPHIHHLQVIANKPETSPKSVKRRVDYMNAAAERLHVDSPIVNIDVDQGAHLWWSGHQMLDIAGLVDMSMAHQKYKPEFIREYVFKERRPTLAHVHGGWANKSKINRQPEWKRDYVEIPGYPTGKALHVGNHVRKELLVKTEWADQPERHIQFANGVELVGFRTVATEVGVSQQFYLEIALRTETTLPKEGLRFQAFLADGQGNLQVWDLPPGYDWYTVDLWKKGEIFWGRFSLPVTLPEGTYDLGFVATGADGVLAALSSGAPGATLAPASPRFLAGEVLFPPFLKVIPTETATQAADAARELALKQAAAGDCASAETAWDEARYRMTAPIRDVGSAKSSRRTKQKDWLSKQKPAVMDALAACVAKQAEKSNDLAEQVALITKARRYNHREPTVLAVTAPLAEAANQRGMEAFEKKDWEAAYRELSASFAFEPWRSWTKRYMEEARAYRLGIDPESVAKKKAETEARKKKSPVNQKLPKPPTPEEAGEEGAGPEADEE